MQALTIALDPGSTSSRALYTLKQFRPSLLLMESEVAEVSARSIEVYEANKLGLPSPEDSAWIEYKGVYRAIGFLAKNHFHADLNLRDSKIRQAVWKALALIGAIAQNHALGSGSTIRFGVLLPYGEYQDRELFEQLLGNALSGYRFRGQEFSFELEDFQGKPEGSVFAGADSRVELQGFNNFSCYAWAPGCFGLHHEPRGDKPGHH